MNMYDIDILWALQNWIIKEYSDYYIYSDVHHTCKAFINLACSFKKKSYLITLWNQKSQLFSCIFKPTLTSQTYEGSSYFFLMMLMHIN